MNLKKILTIFFPLFLALGLTAQQEIIVIDNVEIADTTINGQKQFKAVSQVVTETEYLDSAAFVNALAIPIYNEYFKRRQAIKIQYENESDKLRIRNGALIDSVTGLNYFELISSPDYTNNVLGEYARLWRITHDTLLGVFLYWDGALINGQIIAMEIDNAGQVVNGDPPSYVVHGVRLRFNPYNSVVSRVTLFLWNGASYDNVWNGFEDVGLMGPIFDEEGRNTGRSIWSSDRRVRNVRLLRFPPIQTP